MSLALRIDTDAVAALGERLERVRRGGRRGLMEALAAEGESQTRRRLTETKAAPDGEPWQAWSERYARTRRGGHALLQGEGDLLDSIIAEADAGRARWGSNLAYAAIHQAGGTEDMPPGPAGIPARPYLGISDDDADALVAIANDWLNRQLRKGR